MDCRLTDRSPPSKIAFTVNMDATIRRCGQPIVRFFLTVTKESGRTRNLRRPAHSWWSQATHDKSAAGELASSAWDEH